MDTTTENSQIEETIDAIKTRIDDATTKAKQQTFVSMFRAKTFIEKNPFQSVALAVGAGWALKLVKPGPVVTIGLFAGLAYLATRFDMQ
jgi:ElaB/YqjD/DUF883 family membrane-anchored ribosome-binding protein